MSEKKKKTIEERTGKTGEVVGSRVKKGSEKTNEALGKGVKIGAGKMEKPLKTDARKATEAISNFEKGVMEGIEEEKKRIRGERQRVP